MRHPRSLNVKKALEDAEYCTVPEAASVLKVNPSTVWRWIYAGKLPAYRVGAKNIRIRREDLDSIVTPVNRGRVAREARGDIWVDYDPEEVKKALARSAGTWADLDTEALIDNLHRARDEGSRPVTRP